MNKYDLGLQTGFASDVRITIYIWVSALLAIVVLKPAVVIDEYLQILWRHGSKLIFTRDQHGFLHPE